MRAAEEEGIRMSFGNLQKMALQMQQNMQRVEEELAAAVLEGTAGGGVVRAVVTGKQHLVRVEIDPSAVDPADVEMLQDLVVAAVNDALRAARELSESKMAAVTGGLRLPGHVGAPAGMASAVIAPVARLIEAFSRLPGIGPKTAQRLTYHLLRAPDAEARTLAAALVAVRDEVVFCATCFNISDAPSCPICRDGSREGRRLCVVEEPLDVLAIERTGEWRGRYHVLNGAISPMDGIGPERLRIRRADRARRRCRSWMASPSRRSSLRPTHRSRATSPRPTSRSGWRSHVGLVTRLARGLPVGGDLEYADEITLIRAFQGRRRSDP